ncbi:acyl carrier protein [Amycolatopsis sp. EV170708-02-1]|uniref:acyl carrier protein n=1 Tax=Amycolatopsis sp. EV170708-02-1 TaxID=2919322 RepID=UPI001F0C2B9B|nr:phosphopantetheine-binding protein [Amycolatopsis sp. EV170708-02-1]UMP06848.1 phosphopantetheine-binding protein [Amycolatopsis sp. EV170708-02-1]
MFEVLQEILVDKLKIPAAEVRAEVTPEDADLDSLTIVELSMVLEKEFGIEISEDEIKSAATLGDIARLMEQRSTRV